jgi:hypothetical protein
MTTAKAGFRYKVEQLRHKDVALAMGMDVAGLPVEGEYVQLSVESVENLIPTEGLDYILGASLTGATQLSAWYLALFEGNYTPVSSVTAATFPTSATESIAYDEPARVVWTPGVIAGGVATNSASVAVFTMNATKTIYGCAQSSVSTKSATTGTLISIALFPAPKPVVATDLIRITNPITITSA